NRVQGVHGGSLLHRFRVLSLGLMKRRDGSRCLCFSFSLYGRATKKKSLYNNKLRFSMHVIRELNDVRRCKAMEPDGRNPACGRAIVCPQQEGRTGMNASSTIRVAVNGYGVIGKRVADAVAKQDDMSVAGVSDVTTDWRARIPAQKGYALYGATDDTVRA